MKSLAAVATLVAVVLLAASCGGGGKKSSSGGGIRVGLVTDIGQLNDRGFNHLAYVGLLRAKKELGVQARVAESNSPADYVPNLTSFARQGYDLVIAVGFTEIEAMNRAAKRFPDTNFAIVDVSKDDLKGHPKNVLGLLFREQEVGYLAGYLAGLVEKPAPGPDVVSSVGGQKQPPVDRFIAGYQAGAKKADPGIKTINGYSQDFVDQARCKEVALHQIDQGSGVVFQVAGGCGLGALDAAKERNVWGIGVDADQSFLGGYVLTSATKRVDVAVYSAIKDVVDGKFKGGDAVYGLKVDGVGLGKISPKVSKADMDAVNKIRDDIVAGRIKDIPTQVP
jgi:basic membrane protein A